MNHYRCHRVYVTKIRGERDSDCVEFFLHNTPLPYNSSSENVIIVAHKLAHALKYPALQAPFYNIGNSQMVVIEQLSDIFSKVADNLQKISDPPQQQPVGKSAIVPQKVCPNMTKPLLSVQPNIIEDDDGKFSTSFQNKVHMSPSFPNIILPEVPVPPPRVLTDQPPRVDTEGPSSNLRSRGKNNPIPHFALKAQFQKVHEANAVTHQISRVAQLYRHLVKVPNRKIL